MPAASSANSIPGQLIQEKYCGSGVFFWGGESLFLASCFLGSLLADSKEIWISHELPIAFGNLYSSDAKAIKDKRSKNQMNFEGQGRPLGLEAALFLPEPGAKNHTILKGGITVFSG